jgi:hypothetical protein
MACMVGPHFRILGDDGCFLCSEKLSFDNAAYPFLAYSGIPAVSFCFCEVRLKNSTAFSSDLGLTLKSKLSVFKNF